MGDLALMCLAELLQQEFRSDSVVFRLGGDEFGIILYETGKTKSVKPEESKPEKLKPEESKQKRQKQEASWQEELKRHMDEICRRYKERVCGLWPEHDTSLSYGGVICSFSMDFNAAYGKADKALYEAKNRGKNNGVIIL